MSKRPSHVHAPLVRLVQQLDSSDAQQVRRAGDELVERGVEAVPHLVRTLEEGSPSARRAAAFLLGKTPATPETTSVLVAALKDSEPKVRKNAAVSLGRLAEGEVVHALIAALDREGVQWVRPSLILALGKVGGPLVPEALQRLSPRSPEEAEAIRKASDRATQQPCLAAWRDLPPDPGPVYTTVPVGLEDVASAEARAAGLSAPEVFEPGVLEFRPGIHPQTLRTTCRSAYAPAFLVGRQPLSEPPSDESLEACLSRILERPKFLDRWQDWVEVPDQRLRYRLELSVVHKSRKTFKNLLALVRRRLEPFGLYDSPSNYALELRVTVSRQALSCFAVPCFIPDERFRYRVHDVGASIDPVVAAGLARLLRSPRSRSVVDPTCGSGTLLVERALLDGEVRLFGLDISPTAVRAARGNIAAAGLGNRIHVSRGDAALPETWPTCDEAVMNLPFGVRSRRQDRDLDVLYDGVARCLSIKLRRGGRALVYTANRRLFTEILERHRLLSPVHTRTIGVGGLRVGLWLVERVGSSGNRTG